MYQFFHQLLFFIHEKQCTEQKKMAEKYIRSEPKVKGWNMCQKLDAFLGNMSWVLVQVGEFSIH